MWTGANTAALSAIPSFTNPNDISIITGHPPAMHGIAGNRFHDRKAGEEVMMKDARFLCALNLVS
jgi:phosphonoacetate hydrolase